MSNNDLISREALKKAMNKEALNLSNGGRIFIENINKIIDNAPTVEGKLSDKQIEEIADLLEIQWGYEGIREDVTRILRGE